MVRCQRSNSLSGNVNHIGIVIDNLDEIEKLVSAVGFDPHMHTDYESARRFYLYDDTGLEIGVVLYNS